MSSGSRVRSITIVNRECRAWLPEMRRLVRSTTPVRTWRRALIQRAARSALCQPPRDAAARWRCIFVRYCRLRVDDIAEREGGTRLQLNALGFAVDHPATTA